MRDLYKEAGVDVESGYDAVERIKGHVARTTRNEVLGGIGQFGGLFDLSNLSYEQPVLVSSTDGVGTKLKIAIELNRHDTIGQDLVAMCVNDILSEGADPLFFLDYIATGTLSPERVEQIVSGIASACVEAGCALLGGETAEMPGMYRHGDYDVAGFAVGITEKHGIITGESIAAGDVLLGLPSSGFHSNGFSLVRKWVSDLGLDLHESYGRFPDGLGEALLEPTRLYGKAVTHVKQQTTIKGIAHITGGGFEENLPRMLPQGMRAQLSEGSFPIPDVYRFFMERTSTREQDLYSTFNMGIGMVLALMPDVVEDVQKSLYSIGEPSYVIGKVTSGERGVAWT
ncbi:phosphoribosylaminoimidazole synthetase [Pontibacillus halophilus JSM 076056 = DSM 19796]|uniref:Phosphoribosylformylglycinamidine cyclo-ligase n=1 Tax=Pontibacillus halophilus JSM 076056 = DSM 19796 TaxID=1385510 RepID=A0A0A5GG85_9BACI|nr:phosphoribosylformylglycinamidine cyclo-ligase [Pontibacillus halophilus]KGX90238.1 phosphoribosylaminoimidazole synthetase [Pontibacillus halophilus JSM 076056 = DSM 19796]